MDWSTLNFQKIVLWIHVLIQIVWKNKVPFNLIRPVSHSWKAKLASTKQIRFVFKGPAHLRQTFAQAEGGRSNTDITRGHRTAAKLEMSIKQRVRRRYEIYATVKPHEGAEVHVDPSSLMYVTWYVTYINLL